MRAARLVSLAIALSMLFSLSLAWAADSGSLPSVASSAAQIDSRLSDTETSALRDTRTIIPRGTAVQRAPMTTEPVLFIGGQPVQITGDKDNQGVDLDMGLTISEIELSIEHTGTVAETWELVLTDLPGCSVDPQNGIFFASGTQYSTFTLDRTVVAEGEYFGEITLDWGTLPDQIITVHFIVGDAFWLDSFTPPAGTILNSGDTQLFEHFITVVLWTQPTAEMFFEVTDDKGTLLEPTETATLTHPGIWDFWGDETTTIPFKTNFVTSSTYLVRQFDTDPVAFFQQPYTVKGACDCPLQGDFNADDQINIVDLNLLINVLFLNGDDVKDPACPMPRSDYNCNNISDNVDLNLTISHMFLNGPPPCNPCGP